MDQAPQQVAEPPAGEPQAEPALVFRSVPAVHAYLMRLGYSVAQSSVYNHLKAKLLQRNSDGTFSVEAVEAYARQKLKAADKSAPDPLAERERRAKVERLEAATRITNTKADALEGKYIEREQYEADLEARARVLKSDFINFFRVNMDELISRVGGDPDKAVEVLPWCEDRVESWLDRYARAGELQVGGEV